MTEVYSAKLTCGFCNKLFRLFSLCEMAVKNNIKILEPTFGLKNKILFSDIYDINFFNKQMRKFTKMKNIMVPVKEKDKCNIKKPPSDLWVYSQKKIKKQRKHDKIPKNTMMILVLKSLKLTNENKSICDSCNEIENKNAIHVRIEDDWVLKSQKMENTRKQKRINMTKDESFLTDCDTLIEMYKNKFNGNVFFTTGQNQLLVKKKFADNNIDSDFLFTKELEYEINAAINFELCCKAKIFIGLTRSTFSNLISLKRSLLNNDKSYIYNFKKTIFLRKDKGLHGDPQKAIENTVTIV